ncbi:MAG: GIY-YIG nuclease family protein [Alphaproteobacteria bacterium]|nr:GIY-YIG nuclease family protein [Alphaproteobacteria bacterium]
MAATKRTGEKLYFVYDLVDPRTGHTFYVGKGKGDRPAQHMREAERGVDSDKCEMIREIISAGHTVKIEIVKWFRSEDAAYRFERKRIATMGLKSLTNVAPGGRGGKWFEDGPESDIKLIVLCARRTAGFTFSTDLLMPDGSIVNPYAALIEVGNGLIQKLGNSHGFQWVADKLKAHNVLFQPIENNGDINAV